MKELFNGTHRLSMLYWFDGEDCFRVQHVRANSVPMAHPVHAFSDPNRAHTNWDWITKLRPKNGIKLNWRASILPN